MASWRYDENDEDGAVAVDSVLSARAPCSVLSERRRFSHIVTHALEKILAHHARAVNV